MKKVVGVAVNDLIDLSKVYPRIKGVFSKDQTDHYSQGGKESFYLSSDQAPYYQPLADDIGVFYMIDRNDKFELIKNKDISTTITAEKVHEAALQNLLKVIGEKTVVRGDLGSFAFVTNGGNFEAAMLLIDAFWDKIEPLVKGSIYVAIPAVDILLIVPKNNPEAKEKMRESIRHYFRNPNAPGLIVKNIYERTKNAWLLNERVT